MSRRMHYVKSHGLGNDYIVIDPDNVPFRVTPMTVPLTHRKGLVDRDIRVTMPGGALEVTVGEGYAMRLRGPVEEVMSGDFSPDLLRRLG